MIMMLVLVHQDGSFVTFTLQTRLEGRDGTEHEKIVTYVSIKKFHTLIH
jgi:hypothetical protein